MRGKRYEEFLKATAGELLAEVLYFEENVSGEFNCRHDGPFTLKAERRMLTRRIKEYRQKREALAALRKQIAQPVMYAETDIGASERCPNCYEDIESKEWHYKYCPLCGQRLEWGTEK